jgi:PGF-pre-PGF domain-containing protein
MVIQIIKFFEIIANQPTIIDINNSNFDLTRITITATEDVINASLIITKNELPKTNVSNGLPSGVSYQAFEIITTKINNTIITNATIDFKVSKSWISNQNITADNIVLYRMKKNETVWNPLNTALLNEDTNYFYFSALTPGFSSFVIFLDQKCTPNMRRCSNNENQICLENSTWQIVGKCSPSNVLNPVIYAIILAGISAIVIIILFRKKIKRKIKKVFRKFY